MLMPQSQQTATTQMAHDREPWCILYPTKKPNGQPIIPIQTQYKTNSKCTEGQVRDSQISLIPHIHHINQAILCQ